jgi:hypothetical protein
MKEVIKALLLTLLIAGVTIGLGFVIALKMYQPQTNNYDVNRDGKVSITDLVILNKYIMEQPAKDCDVPIVSTSEDGIINVVC